MVQPYKHEPFTDFTIEENRQAYLNGVKNSRRIFRAGLRSCDWRRKSLQQKIKLFPIIQLIKKK